MMVYSKPLEIAKRTSIFTASGQAGTMFAGVMMTAIREGMDGYNGMPGWKWVFLIGMIQISKSEYMRMKLTFSLPNQMALSHCQLPWWAS
jgi:hypothetical protein